VEGALGAGRLAFVRRRIPPHHQGVPCVVLLLSSFIKSYKVSYVPLLHVPLYRYTAIPLSSTCYRLPAPCHVLPAAAVPQWCVAPLTIGGETTRSDAGLRH
jgi:hypothetical protein